SGHMPGAGSLPIDQIQVDGRLKDAAELIKIFDDLGVEQEAYLSVNQSVKQSLKQAVIQDGAGVVERIDWPSLGGLLKAREKDSHKGTFGHVLVVGGNYGMAGAVAMAGEAALRVGAGMVSIATRPEHVSTVTALRPEMMTHGIESAAQLGPLINKATVIVLGPGLGQDKWAQQVFGAIIDCGKSMVIDADALNLLAVNCFDENAEQSRERTHRWILTPHPGEAGRLMACESSEIGQDRFRAALQLQKKYRATVVLKGAGTLVSAEMVSAEAVSTEIAKTQSLRLASVGNPGMASAGMGDVLSGIIGGLLAQGLNDVDAASLGVVFHGAAADRSAAENGERGLLATDLFAHLRILVNGSIADN
ncbi:MAG: NAD(P)H-hydrate dehydratase, partial [Moraxellaceae bacterium]